MATPTTMRLPSDWQLKWPKDARSPAQFLVVELTEFSPAPDKAQATNRNLQALITALDMQKTRWP